MAETAPVTNAFLTTALTRWRTAETAEGPQRTEGELDLRFLNLDQWETGDKDNRAIALTIDQIGEPYRQLVGQFRRAHPGIQVSPVDNGADVETAERYQGAIRYIESAGGAKAAREEAFKGMVGPGWGYYRLYTQLEYEDQPPSDPAATFDQCVKYQPIENQFTVFRDPSTPLHEPWKCRWALVVEDVPMEEFRQRWPEAMATNQDCFAATGLAMPEWYPEGSVRVADYFTMETEPAEGPAMALLADGQVVPLDQVPAGAEIVQRQQPQRRVVRLAKITGAEILEGNADKTAGRDQPWPFIPIVPMFGEALTVKGKRTVRGIVRPARDSQRGYNFQASELVYELALAPKSKVMAAFGSIDAYKDQWKRAPSEAFPALYFDAYDERGRQVPPPAVAHFTDSTKIQALTVAINQFKSDLRSTTGWYDTTDPNRKNADQSGRAILARKESQAEGSVNFMESASQAIRFEAMLLLGAIPKLFNRPGRGVYIAGMEDPTQSEQVIIGPPRPAAHGQPAFFQWGAGRYDIRVDIGASYGTRRQEAATFQLELMKALPDQMSAAMAPIAVRNMDGPGNREIADRLDRTLPPEIKGDEKEGQDDPEALKAKLQQAGQQMQEMGQVIQGLQEAVKTDQVKAEADLQKTQLSAQSEAQQAQQADAMKLEIATMEMAAKTALEREKMQAEIALAQMKIDADREIAQMKIDADLEKARITAMATARAQRREEAHEAGMAGMAHAHDVDTARLTHRQGMEQRIIHVDGGETGA